MQLWKEAGVDQRKLVVIIPFVSQTYQLKDPLYSAVGAKTIGPGQAGRYTKVEGIMAYYEVICVFGTFK